MATLPLVELRPGTERREYHRLDAPHRWGVTSLWWPAELLGIDEQIAPVRVQEGIICAPRRGWRCLRVRSMVYR